MSDSLQPLGIEHSRLPFPSQPPGVCSNSCSLSWWCHPTIILCCPLLLLPSIFSSIRILRMSRLFTSGGQNIGASASLVLPMNIQGWFPLGLAGLVFLMSKVLWRVFSSTTVQKHNFFCAQPSLWPNSHIGTWLLEKP